MWVCKEERIVYNKIIPLAVAQLRRYDKNLPTEHYIKYLGDFSYVSFPTIKQRYMIKLCPSFWERKKIQLTVPELRVLKDMDGIVFLLGKQIPPELVQSYDYDYLLVSSSTMQVEANEHLKSVESACFFKFMLTFYNSRLFTWGNII